MDDWTPAFRSEYRERASRLRCGGIDIERSYRLWLTHLLGKRAQAVHERSMRVVPEVAELTRHQVEVLTEIARGRACVEAAALLGISVAAAQDRAFTAQKKLGARNGTHAVALAIRSGQVILDQAA